MIERWYIMGACDLRASNGLQCARDFGAQVGRDERRLPTYQEIRAHVPGFWQFSAQHRSNIYRAATSRAQWEISNHPSALKNIIDDLKAKLAESNEKWDKLRKLIG